MSSSDIGSQIALTAFTSTDSTEQPDQPDRSAPKFPYGYRIENEPVIAGPDGFHSTDSDAFFPVDPVRDTV